MKNKENTKRKLIESVGSIIENEGVNKLGVNKVAKAAGVSKVLIYRYFGGYHQLLMEYTIRNNFMKKCLAADQAENDLRYSMYQKVSQILNEQSSDFYNQCESEAQLVEDVCNDHEKIPYRSEEELPVNSPQHLDVISTLLMAGTDHLIFKERSGINGKKNAHLITQRQDLIKSIEKIVDWTLG